MEKLDQTGIVFGLLYASAAIFLLVASYRIYIKRFKRNKLLAVSQMSLTTSRYDVYDTKTQFLIELPEFAEISFTVSNEDKSKEEVLFKGELDKGENIIDFDPSKYENGIYYLSLKTKGSSILRKIKIANTYKQ